MTYIDSGGGLNPFFVRSVFVPSPPFGLVLLMLSQSLLRQVCIRPRCRDCAVPRQHVSIPSSSGLYSSCGGDGCDGDGSVSIPSSSGLYSSPEGHELAHLILSQSLLRQVCIRPFPDASSDILGLSQSLLRQVCIRPACATNVHRIVSLNPFFVRSVFVPHCPRCGEEMLSQSLLRQVCIRPVHIISTLHHNVSQSLLRQVCIRPKTGSTLLLYVRSQSLLRQVCIRPKPNAGGV